MAKDIMEKWRCLVKGCGCVWQHDLFPRFLLHQKIQWVYGFGKLARFIKPCWVLFNPPKRTAIKAWRQSNKKKLSGRASFPQFSGHPGSAAQAGCSPAPTLDAFGVQHLLMPCLQAFGWVSYPHRLISRIKRVLLSSIWFPGLFQELLPLLSQASKGDGNPHSLTVAQEQKRPKSVQPPLLL